MAAANNRYPFNEDQYQHFLSTQGNIYSLLHQKENDGDNQSLSHQQGNDGDNQLLSHQKENDDDNKSQSVSPLQIATLKKTR